MPNGIRLLQRNLMPPNTIVFSLLVFLLNSCSDRPQSILTTSSETPDDDLDFASLVAKQTGGGQDLASFLNSGNEVYPINVIDGADEEKISERPTTQTNLLPLPPESKVVAVSKMPASYEAHTIPKSSTSLEDDFQISLQELRSLNARKDQTIASLTRLNEELLLELQRLRTLTSVPSVRTPGNVITGSNTSQLYKLQNEIANLKSNLMDKSRELDGLRLRNDQFVNGIDSLQPRVLPVPLNTGPRSYEEGRNVQNADFSIPSNLDTVQNSGTCTLEFDAVVTLLNGKSKEVFYTEFFLVSNSLTELLFEEGFFLKDYPQVSSFEELWAKARKSPFSYPGVYKRIRNILLEQVEQGKGHRIRTDIDGFAEFKNIVPASYYLLGTAPVGKIGAVWNNPIRLKPGSNRTSLSLANANWRD